MNRDLKPALLSIPANLRHLQSVRSFIEETAVGFLFGKADRFRIALAAEEIFSYLCSLEATDGLIEIGVRSVGYQLRVSFLFDGAQFDPWAFNLGAQVSPDDEASLEGLGLLLASRMVDSFAINLRQNGRIELLLLKDKTYPDMLPQRLMSAHLTGNWRVRDATPDDIHQFAIRSQQTIATASHPPFLSSADRLIDMVASGDYSMVAALDGDSTVIGGALWQERNERSIECFGPYAVTDPPVACGGMLMEALLSRIAKQRAVCLLSRWTTSAMPPGEFELLGEIVLRDANGDNTQSLPVAYRQLKEDVGSRVWVVPEIEGFLSNEYDRLFFAREMLTVPERHGPRPAHSVFAAAIDRVRHAATLTAVLDGEDANENLQRQLAALAREGVPNVFFEIDLAVTWQAALSSVLLKNGFLPKFVMPYAGRGDIVLFQQVFE